MRKLLTPIILFSISVSPAFSYASEQTELDQALHQLEAAKKALKRAQIAANSKHIKSRIYFDYTKAQEDINLIKQGINRYINGNRSQPRDPRQIRTLSGDYDHIKVGSK
ncbi:RAQPRD family integrative conjugative element protein [Pasteurella skyensis]|uniref:integrative conjugative element protein, RAQPRD family n=1 Tax=Phocoenobacter skyensis TaxID=97481 RepID=UPI002771C8F3|nr:RAQPRD family integrative conjugative element protein [Pasteurella skyensis]MDP8189074.1 RAQPRD family integrative conjugative element protein [Pasteurella skyensis]